MQGLFLHFRGEQSSNFDKMGRVLEIRDRGICIRTKSKKTCLSSVVSSVFGRFVADIVGPKISSSYSSSFSWFDSSSRRHGFFHLLRYWTKAVPHTDALRISDPTPKISTRTTRRTRRRTIRATSNQTHAGQVWRTDSRTLTKCWQRTAPGEIRFKALSLTGLILGWGLDLLIMCSQQFLLVFS